MGLPKKKRSKMRGRHRRASQKLSAPRLVECPQCHNMSLPHRVCPECGYYKGKEIIAK